MPGRPNGNPSPAVATVMPKRNPCNGSRNGVAQTEPLSIGVRNGDPNRAAGTRGVRPGSRRSRASRTVPRGGSRWPATSTRCLAPGVSSGHTESVAPPRAAVQPCDAQTACLQRESRRGPQPGPPRPVDSPRCAAGVRGAGAQHLPVPVGGAVDRRGFPGPAAEGAGPRPAPRALQGPAARVGCRV